MSINTSTPLRDSSPFFVSSLNSFNRFSKGAKPAARRQFDAMNDEPKIPSLFTALKASAKPSGKPSTPVKKNVKVPASIVIPVRKPPVNKIMQKPVQKTPRQLPTPPSVKIVRREAKPLPKPPAKVDVAPKKAQTPPKPLVVVKPKPSSPTPVRSAQLATPPPTPPLAPIVKKIAPKSTTPRTPVIKKADKPVVRDPSPTPRVKAFKVKSIPTIPKRVVKKRMEPVSVPVPVMAVVATPTAADIAAAASVDIPAQVEVPAEVKTPVAVEVRNEADAEVELEVSVEAKAPADIEVPATVVSVRKPEIKLEEIIQAMRELKNTKTEEMVVACVTIPTSHPEAVVEEPSAAVNQMLAMEQLKNVLKRRAEATVIPETPRKEGEREVSIVEPKAESVSVLKKRDTLVDRTSTMTPKENVNACDETKAAAGGVGSGIQARMAALFGNVTASRDVPAVVPGAYVRRLKIPELGEGDQASKNRQIQREVETLRTLKRVGNGSSVLVKTRAFGGSMAANYAVEDQPQVSSLEIVAIMERRRKDKA